LLGLWQFAEALDVNQHAIVQRGNNMTPNQPRFVLFRLAAMTIAVSASTISAFADERAVESTRHAFQEAWNAHNADAVLKQFAADARLSADGQSSEGTAAIRNWAADEFKEHPKRKWEFRRESIRFVTKSVSLEDVICIMTDPEQKPISGRVILIYVETDKNWRISECRLPAFWKKKSPRKYLPLVAAPKQHKPVFEDEYVRVFRVINPPGGVAPAHVHVYPSVMITDTPATIVVRNEQGVVLRRREAKTLPLVNFALPSKSPYSVQNVDNHPIKLWRIEIKRLPWPIKMEKSN
jgi:uncharacterized protein (TIGR02246 family)